MIELNLQKFYSGWLEVEITNNKNSETLIASNCYDTPLDILKAMDNLLNHEKHVKIFWEGELSSQLLIAKKTGDNINVEVFFDEKEDLLSPNENINLPFEKYIESRKYQKIFSVISELKDLIKEVLNLFDELLNKYEISGYQDIWELPFPVEEYNKLKEDYYKTNW